MSDEQGSDAGAQARAEMSAAMHDPNHAMHGEYTRGTEKYTSWANELYRKAFGDGTVELGAKTIEVTDREDTPIGGEDASKDPPRFDPAVYGPNAESRHALIEGELRKAWGADFDVRREDASAAARELFKDQGDVFQTLGRTVRLRYGPAGEVAAMRFLADLARIQRGDR